MGSRLVYLVRHGDTEGESSIRYHGRNDVALSDVGRAQIRRLRPLVRDVSFAAVLHSPKARAVESAQILIDSLRQDPGLVEAVDGFREIDFGVIEGMTDGEIRAAMPEWHRAWRAREVDGYPEGDTIAGFEQRVRAALRESLDRHPHGDLLVVAHRGIVRVALQSFLPLDDAGAGVRLASLSVLRVGESAELVSVDQVPDVD